MTPEQRQRPGASDLVAIGELQSAHGNVGAPHVPSFVSAYRAQHSDDPPPHLRTERSYTVVRVTEVLAATQDVEPGDLIAVATRDAYSWRATPAVYGATVALFLRRAPPSAHTDLPMYRYAPSLEAQVFLQEGGASTSCRTSTGSPSPSPATTGSATARYLRSPGPGRC